MKEIKARIVVGKNVSGTISVLKEPVSFKNLGGNLKGKILVYPDEIIKSVLEKARALGVVAIVAENVSKKIVSGLKEELKSSWLQFSFALFIPADKVDWKKIEGKKGKIEVEKRRMIVELT